MGKTPMLDIFEKMCGECGKRGHRTRDCSAYKNPRNKTVTIRMDYRDETCTQPINREKITAKKVKVF